MSIRNTHRKGDYLLMDGESGLVHYASECVKIWDGTWRHKSNYETRNPQEFVQAGTDPHALSDVRPDGVYPEVYNALPEFIGETNIPFPTGGPAGHLFGGGGIGAMTIEGGTVPFVVR